MTATTAAARYASAATDYRDTATSAALQAGRALDSLDAADPRHAATLAAYRASSAAASLAHYFAYEAKKAAADRFSPTDSSSDLAARYSLAAYRASVVASAAYRRAAAASGTDYADHLDGTVYHLFSAANQRRIFAAQSEAARYFGTFGLGTTGRSLPIAL